MKNEQRERLNGYTLGRVEVFAGCMFAGKSTRLIAEVRQATRSVGIMAEQGLISPEIVNEVVLVFKPKMDNRRGEGTINTNDGDEWPAIEIESAEEILSHFTDNTHVIAIDEAQFVKGDLVGVVEQLANSGRRVIVAGLNLDFKGEDFGQMAQLINRAEEVTKLEAVCAVCGSPHATRTQRLIHEMDERGEWQTRPSRSSDPLVILGGEEAVGVEPKIKASYQARCRVHHELVA